MATSRWTMLVVPLYLLLWQGKCHATITNLPPRDPRGFVYLISSLTPDFIGSVGMPSRISQDLSCIIGSSLPLEGVPPSSVAAYRDIAYGVEEFWQTTRPRCRLQGEPYIYEIPRGDDAIEKGPHTVYTLAPAWVNVTTRPSVRFTRAIPRQWSWSKLARVLPVEKLRWQKLGWKDAVENGVTYIVSTEDPEFAMDTGIQGIQGGHESCDFEYRLRIPGTTRLWTLGFRDPRRAVEVFLKLRGSHCPNTFFYIYAVRPDPLRLYPVSERDGFPNGLDAVVTSAQTWFGPSNSQLLRYARLSMNLLSSDISLDEIGENLQEAAWERVQGRDQELEETLGPEEDCTEPDADEKVAEHLNNFFSLIQKNHEFNSMPGPQEVLRRLHLPVWDPQSLDNTACANSLNRVDFEITPMARGVVERGDCCRLRERLILILSKYRTRSRVSRLAPAANRGQEIETCSHFSQLMIGFQLRNESREDGTGDNIQISLGSALHEQVVWIIEHPKPGFHMWKSLDIKEIFRQDLISPKDLSHISFVSRRTKGDAQDGWYFQGLKLRGYCADSSLIMTLDRFASVNRWMDRPTDIRAAIVWGETIYKDDWHATSCTQFDQLDVQFVISNHIHSDTKDDIFIHFGNTNERADTLLMSGPRLGQAIKVAIDLKSTFGKDVVPVADVQSIELYSKAALENNHRGLPEGGWRSGVEMGLNMIGISLHGRCASSRFLLAFWSTYDMQYVNRVDGNDTRSNGLKYDISVRSWEWNRRSQLMRDQ
ncbi:hypothetical protein CP533_4958 [Ophiocordyceps camponoti-saundersi (nom. inval.)]|nr:hypothetical protein CP533_4958 [Ophiocordyceps camponoti-saundersi (nom. inval.)]